MILVTGGTGLLGTHVIFQLLKNGKSIRAIKRKNSNLEMIENVFNHYSKQSCELLKKIEWIEADILDIPSLELVFKNITQVYHCAAMISFDSRFYKKMYKVNVEGTENMIALSLKNKIEKFCFVSSTAAIAKNSIKKINTEDNKWIQDKNTSGYAITKYTAEKIAWRAIEEGLKVSIINPTIILGPSDIKRSSSTLFKSIKNGLNYYTDGINAIVDARDVAKSMIMMMERNIFGNRLLCCNENISFKSLISQIAEEFNLKKPSKRASVFATDIFWRIEYLRTFFFGGIPKLTKENAKNLHNKIYYSNKKIKEVLNFEFYDTKDTIKNCVNFYKKMS